MDKNFKVRVIVGVSMFVVALVGLYTFDSIPFKILYGLFALMSLVELLSFFKKKVVLTTTVLAVLEICFLMASIVFVSRIDSIDYFWYIIMGVPGYDVFAYLFGKMLGGRIFKKSRPFPKISKNKTWEGTILGLVFAVGLVVIKMAISGDFATEWMYLLCGPLALCGDLFESYLKRQFGVKDSNEILIRNKTFSKVELLVGGSEGHGGFLDRIDSMTLTCSVLLILSLI